MQMKLEVYTHHEENEAPVCSTSASSSQCLDDFQDQISSKDTAAQFKHNHQNSFVNQEIQIKIEPETMEANVSFQLDGNDLGDGLKEPVEDPLSNGIIISNIGSLTHQTKPFKPPFINQEMSKQHAMHPSQTGKRPAGVEQNKARPHRPQHFPNVHEKPVFFEENITKETKSL
ncbi:hypothetical protein DNTS_029593 [Danionella cerebrum]|uniref:Uncharacterized protein n=1 Tax=Danionella cerebrum TaxID=2873325 RepID=A0A553RJZ4_9TELE|nr:hypothetical protein DNTS_029593 [Danionella translucida]